jgi:predicted dinucleotide-binding enzyme
MKIAILGETKLAITLGTRYLSRGMDVFYGVAKNFVFTDIEWKIFNKSVDRMQSYEEAIENADVVFICCENKSLKKICQALSNVEVESKIIIDCTNGIFSTGFNCNSSLLKKHAGDQRVFKAFNNLGLDYPGSDPLGVIKETYYCGEDCPEKFKVKKLIELIGFTAIDAGEFESALLLEAFYHLKVKISSLKAEKTDYHFKLISL